MTGLSPSMLGLFAVAALSVLAACEAQQQFYVDVNKGSDYNDGSSSSPWKTLTHARDAIRSLKSSSGLPDGGVVVNVASGDYDLTQAPLQLNSSDSGTSDKPITYRAMPGAAPLLTAGVRVSPSMVKSARLPNGITGAISIDLKKAGVTDYGHIGTFSGLGQCPASGGSGRLEVFINGEPLVIARYPNINATSGYWQWTNIDGVSDPSKSYTWSASDNRPASWVNETGPIYVHGYWKYDWADGVSQVASIDPSSRTITVNASTPPVYNFEKKARWFGFNIKAELDAPGEYYVDETAAMLYLIPPSGSLSNEDEIFVSVGSQVLSLENLEFVNLEGLSFQYARSTGVSASNVTSVRIVDASFSNMGGNCASVGGTNVTIYNVTANNCGCHGIVLTGGDTKTLVAGGNTLEGATISHFARHTRTYNPGLTWSGVGNVYRNISISNGPHAAILGGGNDCLFEYNSISDVAFEVDDSGSFYTGRNWYSRGNVIRYSSFRSVRTRVPVFLGSPSVQAIYFDDQMSGYEVYNNSFYDCQAGVFIGGGRRHHVKFNTFEKCDTAIHVDTRGLSWQRSYCQPGGTFDQELQQYNYKNPPYAVHYPYLPYIFEEMPCYPVYNEIVDNTACDCEKLFDFNTTQLIGWRNVIVDNNGDAPSGCVGPNQ